MKKEILNKEQEVVSLKKSIEEKEKILIPIRDKIIKFNLLVSDHNTPVKALLIIEQNTFPNVWFSEFNFNFSELTLSLLAHTENLATVEQQIAHLKKTPLFEEVSLSGVTFSEEAGVDFSINIIFSSEVFSKTF